MTLYRRADSTVLADGATPSPYVYITVKTDTGSVAAIYADDGAPLANPMQSGPGGVFVYNVTSPGLYTEEYRLNPAATPRKIVAVEINDLAAIVQSAEASATAASSSADIAEAAADVAVGAAEKLSWPQRIGKQTTPVTRATATSNVTTFFGEPVERRGYVESAPYFGKANGIPIKLRRGTLSGGVVTAVPGSVEYVFTSVAGLQANPLPAGVLRVEEGEVLGYFSNGGIAKLTGLTGQAAAYSIAGDVTGGAAGAENTTVAFEIAFVIAGDRVDTEDLDAVHEAADALPSLPDVVENLTGTVVDRIGRQGEIVPGLTAADKTYVLGATVAKATAGKRFGVVVNGPGTIYLQRYNSPSNTHTWDLEVPLTVTAGLNLFSSTALAGYTTAPDIGFALAPGQHVGLYGGTLLNYLNEPADDGIGFYSSAGGAGGTHVASFFDSSLSSNLSIMAWMEFEREGIPPLAAQVEQLRDDFENMGGVSSSLVLGTADLVLLGDGDSLTDPTGPALTSNWLALGSTTLGVTSANFGGSGQSLDDMLVDIATQVAPYAALPNTYPVLIFWEWVNQMIDNVGWTASTVLAKAAAYVTAVRAAGIPYVGLFNAPYHNNPNNVALQGSWRQDGTTAAAINTALGSPSDLTAGWKTVVGADFLVDVGSLSQFQNYNNTTYFMNAAMDPGGYLGVHLTATAQALAARQMRRSLRQFVLSDRFLVL